MGMAKYGNSIRIINTPPTIIGLPVENLASLAQNPVFLISLAFPNSSWRGQNKLRPKTDASAGASVAAKGLFLVDIGYPDTIGKLENLEM